MVSEPHNQRISGVRSTCVEALVQFSTFALQCVSLCVSLCLTFSLSLCLTVCLTVCLTSSLHCVSLSLCILLSLCVSLQLITCWGAALDVQIDFQGQFIRAAPSHQSVSQGQRSQVWRTPLTVPTRGTQTKPEEQQTFTCAVYEQHPALVIN